MPFLRNALGFGLALCLISPIKAAAFNSQCNPLMIKELNEKYTATLLCSSIGPQHFKTCIKTLATVGVVSFLAGMGVNSEANSKLGNAAARADMSRLSKYFPEAMEKLIEKFKKREGNLRDARSLLLELKKHPHLYNDHIANFTSGIKVKTLGSYLKKFGAFAVALAYLESTVFTTPEDCKKLGFSGIQPDDQKYVDFGMNCSRHIDPDFFTLSFDEQLLITQRSPDLCKAITSFRDDLDKTIAKLTDVVPSFTDGPQTDR